MSARRNAAFAAAIIATAVLSSTISAGATALITGAQIQDGSITGIDIKANSLGSGRIADGTLRRADMAPGTLPYAATSYETNQFAVSLPALETRTIDVTCPAGKVAVGGGFDTHTSFGPTIVASYPGGPYHPEIWKVILDNPYNDRSSTGYVYAVCLK